jgi:hypothetical protein
MYSHLPAEMFSPRHAELATSTIASQDVPDATAAVTPRRSRIRRGVATAVAALGVCVAATTVVAVNDATASPHPAKQSRHASATQFRSEMHALNGVGFTATSCMVSGMQMTNYSTNQSVLLTW